MSFWRFVTAIHIFICNFWQDVRANDARIEAMNQQAQKLLNEGHPDSDLIRAKQQVTLDCHIALFWCRFEACEWKMARALVSDTAEEGEAVGFPRSTEIQQSHWRNWCLDEWKGCCSYVGWSRKRFSQCTSTREKARRTGKRFGCSRHKSEHVMLHSYTYVIFLSMILGTRIGRGSWKTSCCACW